MKHDSFPYNETEWNKIVDDAFAPDAHQPEAGIPAPDGGISYETA